MSSNPPDDQAPSDSTSPEPAASPSTPQKTSPTKNNVNISAGGRKVSGAAAKGTPRSAPAGARRRSAHKKQPEPPTLLADFLMGRPSPQRVAADRQRQRRQSLEALKLEMRQSSVRKLQQPGGVRDRVKLWQKKNATAMVDGDPAATPSEPTELFAGGDDDSVTEEDRVRIKMRQRKKPMHKVVVHNGGAPPQEDGPSSEEPGSTRDAADEPKAPESPSKSPPKRVVSDTNWMARKNKKSPPRSKSPPKAKKEPVSAGKPLPKDFLQRPAVNPPISKKVKDWANNVELPPPRSLSPSKHSRSKSREGEGPRVKSMGALFDGLDTGSKQSFSSRDSTDDGIRVTPIRRRKLDDDGIRVRPLKSPLPDEGIKPRPSRRSPPSRDRTPRNYSPSATSRQTSKRDDGIVVMEESDSDHIEVIEDPDSVIDTPTRRPSREKPRRSSKRRSSPRSRSRGKTFSDDRSWISTDESALRSGLDGSDLSSSVLTSAVGAKSLADIPFGYSAFSELDLPTGGKSRPKAQRNPSFKGMPNVFKKVVAEGKKILGEAADPPKPMVANKPVPIESWLSSTLDPFVEKTDASEPQAQKKNTHEKDWPSQTRRRSSAANKHRKASPPPRTELTEITDITESTDLSTELTQTTASTDWTESTDNDENRAPSPDDETVTESERTPTPQGLKRRAATRASPLKSGGRRPFKEVLKEAFRGESGTHVFSPKRYASYEKRPPSPEYQDDEYYDDDYSGLGGQSALTGSSDSWTDDPSTVSDDRYPTSGPRRRPPPTKGAHELSTIVGSIDELSSHDSDLSSHLSDTTVTQSTGLTRDTEVSRQRSNGSGGGLKRRLTKHSDLISVLSLPDDHQVPSRNIKSRASVRRAKSKSDAVTLDDLLQEFVDDENLYQRELKTLVDGVVPVLLTTVLNGNRQNAIDLFGPESPTTKANSMSKAVVNMGIALEKMKNAHRRASHTDVHKLISWMQTVVPIYDSYLDAWRLGFQDLVVNLLPAVDKLDDEDSLIGALPRNAEGDVVNEHGERVDVAHLLKRPILRIKLLSRWAQGVHILLSSYDTLALSGDFDGLQEKARRRQREETARLADDDAANTDTSRTRDLRTLAPLSQIKIAANKQVNAKDLFYLSLAHTNGQRLECQVELIHRDRPSVPSDKGDLLIRETGDGRRTWLMFPPAPWSAVSVRKGEAQYEMVIMIQGSHNGNPWYQLLNLTTDNDEQIEDWIDILGTVPVPPYHSASAIEEEPLMAAPSPNTRGAEVPMGGRSHISSPGAASPEPESRQGTPTKRPAPTRYHSRRPSAPSSPLAQSPTSPSFEKTPTQQAQDEFDDDRSRPLEERMRPEPLQLNKTAPNSTPYRDDGAPPPPVHRSFKAKNAKPPVELPSPGVKRRTSSPLKREYLPSDDSSVTEGTFTSESEPESSEDEFDEGPEAAQTDIGVSIKGRDMDEDEMREGPMDSVVSESLCSVAPSQSASQAGLPNRQSSTPEGYSKYLASISHWHDKRGVWKDVSAEQCSVVVGPGSIEAFALGGGAQQQQQPLVALDLTPLVLLRQSTVVDLEIRSAVQEHCKHRDIKGGNFRFRCPSSTECFDLYMAVHHARLNNQKFIQLENDARFRQFGERQGPADDGDGGSSGKRRSWFGRKNSYRASTRAPSQSQEGGSQAPSSSVSATSFLRRLTGAGNGSFNIARSSVDKQGAGDNSIYGSSSGSSGGMNTPRAPSLYSSARTGAGQPLSPDGSVRIRLHLLVTTTRWEDYGNCLLQIRRAPPGMRQALRANHGLEKRVTVTTVPRKEAEAPRIVLDAVLGSGCFTPMGSRGVSVGIWEELKGKNGEVGVAPATGGAAGSIKKWCFQCGSAQEAAWVLRLVHQEVMGLMP